MPEDRRFPFFEFINLERGLIIALLVLLVGVALLVLASGGWRHLTLAVWITPIPCDWWFRA